MFDSLIDAVAGRCGAQVQRSAVVANVVDAMQAHGAVLVVKAMVG